MAGTYEVALHDGASIFSGGHTVGEKFTFSITCKLLSVKVKPSSGSLDPNVTIFARVYSTAGTLLASGSLTMGGMSAGVYYEIILDSPLVVSPGTTYVVCAFLNSWGNNYITSGGTSHSHSSSPAFVDVTREAYMVYVAGDAYPTNTYDSEYNIKLGIDPSNQTPTTPTDLAVTSASTYTTPTFQCSVSDPDTSQQIKGRFKIYQSDGTTLVATVDSSFRTGAGTVTAEYGTALAVGTYKVKATTVDDLGAESTETALVSFNITQVVTKSVQLLWDLKSGVVKPLQLIWDVNASNVQLLSLSWDILVPVSPVTLELLWDINTGWEPITESTDVWEEVEL